MERAVAESGMEYGGITPVGLPTAWRLLVDDALLDEPVVVIGSGVRRSKLLRPGTAAGGPAGRRGGARPGSWTARNVSVRATVSYSRP